MAVPTRRRLILLALLLVVGVTPLLLVGTHGRALHNGDEAIYAEMAREMVESRRWLDLTWQGQAVHPRPPGAVWVVAFGHWLFGDERAVRWPLALAAALEVALVMVLGTLLFRNRERPLVVGLTAAGWLLTADLFIGYARYLESEPFLCVFMLAALVAREAARERPERMWLFGFFVGCALMTKQVVGGLPLIVLAVDAAGPKEHRAPTGRLVQALIAMLLVWLPWHGYMLERYGSEFIDSYFFANVVSRARDAMLHATRATFYARELWRSEGVLGVIAVAGVVWGLWRARRPDGRGVRMLVLWAIGGFVAFSISASRYDHYLLTIYPALALAAGALLGEWLPLRPWLRGLLIAAVLAAAAGQHLVRDLSAPFDGDEEVRVLARLADQRHRPPVRLYTFNTHPYSARYYTRLRVTTLLESNADLVAAVALKRAGLPSDVEHAPNLAADLGARARPFLLLLPRARADLVKDARLGLLGATPHYLLLEGQ